jgi:DNA-binding response OmpR family regulator
VLYVDDSPVARAAATRVIGAKGIDVAVAASLDEARRVDRGSIAAALLDLEVGPERGTDLANELRSAEPSLPIAFLTAAASGDLLEQARSFGPVFDKAGGLEQVLVWLTALVG